MSLYIPPIVLSRYLETDISKWTEEPHVHIETLERKAFTYLLIFIKSKPNSFLGSELESVKTAFRYNEMEKPREYTFQRMYPDSSIFGGVFFIDYYSDERLNKFGKTLRTIWKDTYLKIN